MNQLDMYGTGWPPENEQQFLATLQSINDLMSGIYLFAPEAVRAECPRVNDALAAIGQDMSSLPPSQSKVERFVTAYRENRATLLDAMAELNEAMRGDVALALGLAGTLPASQLLAAIDSHPPITRAGQVAGRVA